MKEKRKSIKSDLKRIDAQRDGDIDYSEIQELDDSFFTKIPLSYPVKKRSVTIRLDEDVILWLKKPGRGYQTRANRLLRRYMEASK
jgi:uncharacterized protein (DUF4415 family)